MVTIVAHPTSGEVLTPSSKNPEWGTVRVDSSSQSFNNGIMNVSKRTAFIRMKKTDFPGWKAGQVLPGQIIRETCDGPFYPGQDPVINPSTGEVVMRNGVPFYQNFIFTQDASATDTHLSIEQLEARTAGAQAQASKVTP